CLLQFPVLCSQAILGRVNLLLKVPQCLLDAIAILIRIPHHFELQVLKLLGSALRFAVTGHHLLDHRAASQYTDYDQRKQRFDHRHNHYKTACARTCHHSS
ncbi:MAG: hypothetical protein ABW034_12655, partial [Steroidobacteraceae bacterium]